MMNRAKAYLILGSMLAIAGLGAIVWAQTGASGVQPPRLLPYQGFLQQNGTPVEAPGGVEMDFYITTDTGVNAVYERCVPALADPCVWAETQSAVPVAAGRFATQLGGDTPFPDSLFENDELYLGVRVNGEDLVGKQRLLAAPYAITAETAENFSVNGSVQVGDTLDVQGDLDVGGSLSVEDCCLCICNADAFGDVAFPHRASCIALKSGAGTLIAPTDGTPDGNDSWGISFHCDPSICPTGVDLRRDHENGDLLCGSAL